MSKSDARIVRDCNELARQFYRSGNAHGYRVPEGYRFDKATHPQEQLAWFQAALAYEFIEKTDVKNALSNLDE